MAEAAAQNQTITYEPSALHQLCIVIVQSNKSCYTEVSFGRKIPSLYTIFDIGIYLLDTDISDEKNLRFSLLHLIINCILVSYIEVQSVGVLPLPTNCISIVSFVYLHRRCGLF